MAPDGPGASVEAGTRSPEVHQKMVAEASRAQEAGFLGADDQGHRWVAVGIAVKAPGVDPDEKVVAAIQLRIVAAARLERGAETAGRRIDCTAEPVEKTVGRWKGDTAAYPERHIRAVAGKTRTAADHTAVVGNPVAEMGVVHTAGHTLAEADWLENLRIGVDAA